MKASARWYSALIKANQVIDPTPFLSSTDGSALPHTAEAPAQCTRESLAADSDVGASATREMFGVTIVAVAAASILATVMVVRSMPEACGVALDKSSRRKGEGMEMLESEE